MNKIDEIKTKIESSLNLSIMTIKIICKNIIIKKINTNDITFFGKISNLTNMTRLLKIINITNV